MLSLIVFGTLAMAQPVAINVHAEKPASVAKALQDSGYKAVLTKDNEGDPMIASATNGGRFDIIFTGCENHVNCTGLQFSSGYAFTKKVKPTLEKINEFNRDYRFTRAYLDDVGDPFLEMDFVSGDNGWTQTTFAEYVDLWTSLVSEFEDKIDWN